MLPIILRALGVIFLVPGLAWNQFGLDKWFDPGFKTYVFVGGFMLYLAGALMSQFQRSMTSQKSRRKSDDSSESDL